MKRGFKSVLFAAGVLILAAAKPVAAMEFVDVEEQLRIIATGENPTPRIAGAGFRIGSFTYEDPDGTGLGDALATLVGHELLLNTRVPSLGVLVFEGSLSPAPGDRLSYYDKVDRVTAAQGVTLATWGMVRRIDGELVIDTYVQIPRESLESRFTWRHALPAAMGGGELRARLRPGRIRVQRLRVPVAEAERLVAAAAMLGELRQEPDRTSRVRGSVPRGEVFYVLDRADDWVELQTRHGSGWVPLRGHCVDACASLLEAAGFAGALVRFMDKPENSSLPGATAGLSADALAVIEQLRLLTGLRGFARDDMRDLLAPASRRAGAGERSRLDRGAGVPPGGAAFANLHVIVQVGVALAEVHNETGAAYDDLVLPVEKVLDFADELARASLEDPRNIDVLENLAVLFDAAGDGRRAGLARDIVQKATGDSVPRHE